MKNFKLISVVFLAGTVISFSANAQTSLKFIDGIELNPGVVQYATTMPKAQVTHVPATRKPVAKSTASAKTSIEASNKLQFKYAQLLDINVENLTNLSLLSIIDDWWKTRYRYGGTTKKGIDCSALTGLLMRSVYDVDVPRTARKQYADCEKITRDDLKEGDLVFFNTTGGVSHVGLYLANDYFVHASSSNGVTISNLNESYFSARFLGGGRVIETK